MSFGRATYTPAVAPAVRQPTQTPMFNFPTATTNYNTYTPQNNTTYYPMPQAVANNINLGWNSATGQVIQPLTAQQLKQVSIPSYSPQIQIPQAQVMPIVKPNTSSTGFLNQMYDWSSPVSKAPTTSSSTRTK